MDLGEGQIKVVLNPVSENLGIFFNQFTNFIIKQNFCTSTWDILYPVSYGRLYPPHPNPWPVIYIPLVSLASLILWLLCGYVWCKFYDCYHFCSLKINQPYSFWGTTPDPLFQRSTTEISSSFPIWKYLDCSNLLQACKVVIRLW